MKMSRLVFFSRMLCLLVLLQLPPQHVSAREDSETPTPLFAGMMTADIPGSICFGKKMNLEYYFSYLHEYEQPAGMLARPVPLSREAVVDITAKKGKVTGNHKEFKDIKPNSVESGSFSYNAGFVEGEENLEITVKSGMYETTLTLTFWVKKCQATARFDEDKAMIEGPVKMDNTYYGSGDLTLSENNNITGSGTQAYWGNLTLDESLGITCEHTKPWESDSEIIFSGQLEDDETIQLVIDLEELNFGKTEIKCTDDSEGSGGFPIAGGAFPPCRAIVPDFEFDADTVDIRFECPDIEPFTIPFTFIPRSEE